MLTTLFLPV
jgi:hypothetical protein